MMDLAVDPLCCRSGAAAHISLLLDLIISVCLFVCFRDKRICNIILDLLFIVCIMSIFLRVSSTTGNKVAPAWITDIF